MLCDVWVAGFWGDRGNPTAVNAGAGEPHVGPCWQGDVCVPFNRQLTRGRGGLALTHKGEGEPGLCGVPAPGLAYS